MESFMERSSPLAALQHTSLPQFSWGCRAENQVSFRSYDYSLGSRLGSSFNFNELSRKPSPANDYLTWNPSRGSSPSASLAADLSSNFHIDQSPRLPTPRRALFTTKFLGAGHRDTTASPPPPPSSSPAPQSDLMDVSPLPHKVPFILSRQTAFDANTQEPKDDLSSNLTMPVQRAFMPPPERRKPVQTRPSVLRAKASSAGLARATTTEDGPFYFGGRMSAKSPLRGLGAPFGTECSALSGSPLSRSCERASPHRPSFSSSSLRPIQTNTSKNVRRPEANPIQRPRKQFRRSLSMFEHPKDVLDQAEAMFSPIELDPVMDVDDPAPLHLPHFHAESESLPRISRDTLVDVLDGKYQEKFSRSVIVDCRFEYEYQGGHIVGAINHTDKDALADELLNSTEICSSTLVILHCEYSACRAPLMAQHIRGRDRAHNAHRYPNLTYPEMYILDGGYSGFYAQHKLRCFPQNYVEMADKQHEVACERGMGRVKQQRSKLSRAQTFAFGQREVAVDESPTSIGAGSRRRIEGGSALLEGLDFGFGSTRHVLTASRRLVTL